MSDVEHDQATKSKPSKGLNSSRNVRFSQLGYHMKFHIFSVVICLLLCGCSSPRTDISTTRETLEDQKKYCGLLATSAESAANLRDTGVARESIEIKYAEKHYIAAENLKTEPIQSMFGLVFAAKHLSPPATGQYVYSVCALANANLLNNQSKHALDSGASKCQLKYPAQRIEVIACIDAISADIIYEAMSPRITNSNINAAKPENLTILSIKSNNKGAMVNVLTYAGSNISKFLRELGEKGITNVEVNEIKSYMACGRPVVRAEIQIEGNTSQLREAKSTPDAIRQFLGMSNGEAQCSLSIPM